MRIANFKQPNILKSIVTLILSTAIITNCSNQLSTLPATNIPATTPARSFDGRRAFDDLTKLMNYGPRVPDSRAHLEAIDYISTELKAAGWVTRLQQLTYLEKPVNNINAEYGAGSHWILLGAHYDSRIYADQDPILSNRKSPVPGANDGASGVAILLELARVIPNILTPDTKITLVFFDAEDNGDIDHWEWILGSSAYIASITSRPDQVVVLDMLGDKDLQIYQERNSNKELTSQIWNIAADLGYSDVFIPQVKYNMLDDHTPFIRAGIPAVDIIDFDYPYWHTTADTIDKVSMKSLQIVGDTLLAWISENNPPAPTLQASQEVYP